VTGRPRRPQSKGARPPRGRPRPLRWTDRAVRDLDAITDYIARDSPGAAERWILQLIRHAEKAAAWPLAGRRVPELGRGDVREVLARNYRIVYRVGDDHVDILTIFEGHRRLPPNVPPEDDER
jgi:toxin ParE1/3/4